jgi:hypothetical protein
LPVQALPFSSRPQRPSKHLVPDTHWLSEVQVFSQATPGWSHTTMGVQASVLPAAQAPAPSQRETRRATPLLQLAGAQTVPAAYSRHLPRPSHRPSPRQEAAFWSGQPPAGSGVPLGTGVHTPADCGSAQETHEPVQALAQHTPWAQIPDAHSAAVASEQGSPLGFLPQDPFRQTLGVAHWLSSEQRCPQKLPLQRLGAQLRDEIVQAPLRQVPTAKRLAAGSQLSGWQMVPLG